MHGGYKSNITGPHLVREPRAHFLVIFCHLPTFICIDPGGAAHQTTAPLAAPVVADQKTASPEIQSFQVHPGVLRSPKMINHAYSRFTSKEKGESRWISVLGSRWLISSLFFDDWWLISMVAFPQRPWRCWFAWLPSLPAFQPVPAQGFAGSAGLQGATAWWNMPIPWVILIFIDFPAA